MSIYIKEQDTLWPTEDGVYNIKKSLPIGTYTVGAHPMRGFYLKEITDFTVTGKIYGDTEKKADKILNTFQNRPNTTGVLLAGEKGSGKTMLAKLISTKAAEQGMATIVINSAFSGDNFNTFIQGIDEPCVIVFDEFEKVFSNDEQEDILTLLDGVYPTKKLFVLTVNEKHRVNYHMRNRPGRIFYMLEYKGLDVDFIAQYCEDNLNNKTHIPQICRLTMVFESFNFDMLKALVEEMNRYDESPTQALEMLNAKPQDTGSIKHYVTATVNGVELKQNAFWPNTIRGNPVAMETIEFNMTVPSDSADEDDDDNDRLEVELTQEHLKNIDVENGCFTYVFRENKNNIVLTFTRDSFGKQEFYRWTDAI